MPNTEGAGDLAVPTGSSLDLAVLRDAASVSNRAHQALGTQLLGLEPSVVVLGIERPPGADSAGRASREWPNGVITSLLDHGCAMAALLALDDQARFGGSLGLYVQYLRPSDASVPLHVRAECYQRDDTVVRLRATAFHPDHPDVPLATASASAAVAGR